MLTIVTIREILKASPTTWLSAGETKELSTKPTHKRSTWQLGRFAAKQAIRRFLHWRYQASHPLRDIQIMRAPGAKPHFELAQSSPRVPADLAGQIDLSISHAGNVGVADIALIQSDGLVGVDVERIRHFKAETVNSFLTAEERELLSCGPVEHYDQLATLMWSVKEAYLKARGIGIVQHPNTISVLQQDQRSWPTIVERDIRVSASVWFGWLPGGYVITRVTLPQ